MSKRFSIGSVWMAWRGWLYLGIGVKRWLVILGVGAIITGIGIAELIAFLTDNQLLPEQLYEIITLQFLPVGLRIVSLLILGGAIIFMSIIGLSARLLAPFRRPDEGVVQSLRDFSQRRHGPRIVAIGGGTGLPTLLRGLTAYTNNITAIVTVADDGGSSGRLRRELGLLPPGDFRNNLAALARDETLMTQLLQYRFTGKNFGNDNDQPGSQLQGHAFGNLLLAALTGITGSFDEALVAAGRVLALRGSVLPSTIADVTLSAEIALEKEDVHQRVVGESEIPRSGGRILSVSLEPFDVTAYPPAVRAILHADCIVVGPGSLYTSILPNLLVPDIVRAITRSRARKIYICNLATQDGETDNYTVADHVIAIDEHVIQAGVNKGEWLNVILANDNLSLPADTGGGNTLFVRPVSPVGRRMVARDLVDENQPWRHDSRKLADAVMAVISESAA